MLRSYDIIDLLQSNKDLNLLSYVDTFKSLPMDCINDLIIKDDKLTVKNKDIHKGNRKCGYCRVPGHTIKKCPCKKCETFICKKFKIPVSDVKKQNHKCECPRCFLYNAFNLPNPEKAVFNYVSARYPKAYIINSLDNPIFFYSEFNGIWELRDVINPHEKYELNYNIPFDPGLIGEYMITQQFYSEITHISSIKLDHINKLFSFGFNSNFTIKIENKHKTELDRWKEAALKSHYLLQQLDRLGASKNDNLEPIMDMVQDIDYPEHDDIDKERSGITSNLTNVVETTGINESSMELEEL